MFINEAAMKTEYWGTIPYREAWSRQQELFDKLVHQRGSGETCENRLIFCEHPQSILWADMVKKPICFCVKSS